MRILGIDCGSERTGYGVIESDGVRHHMVATGVIRTRARDAMPSRLHQVAAGLREVIATHQPAAAAVESVFFAANASSSLKLAQVRGVALLVCCEASLEPGEYSPLEVKMSVVGYGRAEKQQVQLMVRSLLRLDQTQPEDASDALAVAICHATRFARKAVS
jgi:crossover junction endodeoxyribonuclease RuvC